MDSQQGHQYRKQANDVIRLTLSRIREERQRLKLLQGGSEVSAECELTLAELNHRLKTMLALRKSTSE